MGGEDIEMGRRGAEEEAESVAEAHAISYPPSQTQSLDMLGKVQVDLL